MVTEENPYQPPQSGAGITSTVGTTHATSMRMLLGVIGSAVFGAAVAIAMTGILFAWVLWMFDSHPMDRERDLQRLPYSLQIAAIGGTALGSLADLASSLPKSGVPFLRCCILIAVPAGLTRLFTAPHPKITEAEQLYASYAASFAVAAVVAGVLVWLGMKRRDHPSRALASDPEDNDTATERIR